MSAGPIQFMLLRFTVLAAISVMLWPIGRVAADVVTVGVVTPVPPAGGGVSTSQLIVGNGTNEETNDIWGAVDIDGGTLLQYGSVILGDNEGFFGEVSVSGGSLGGPITQFNLSGSGTSNPVVQVGNEGTGYLTVDSGARMTLTNSSADFSIGLESTGIGYVTVSDQSTMLTSPETIVVGQSGIGNLSVLNGALVRTFSTSRSNYISVGRNVGSIGTAVVDGSRSILSTASTLRVGESGIGSLKISNGALVQAVLAGTPLIAPFPPMVGIGLNTTGSGHITVEGTHSMLQLRRDLTVGDLGQGTLTIRDGGLVQITDKSVSSATVGTLGRIELHDGTFDGSTPLVGFGTTVNGYLGGDGEVRGSVRFNGSSSLEVGPGDQLRFHNAVSNQGAVTINAGEMQFNTTFTNDAAGGGFPTGRISLENGGTVRFGSTLTNNGVISNAHGATNIHGTINNAGTIVVARDTVATFFNPVNNTGTITVLPGGNALFLDSLTFTSAGAGAGGGNSGAASSELGGSGGGSSAGTLVLGVAADSPGAASSHVDVSGVASLAGTLMLTLDGGYSSLVGQTLNLITADNIIGAFDSILLPLVPQGLEVGVLYGPTSVMMEIKLIETSLDLPGDYNNDGFVNAADYSVWRDKLGSATSLPNDDTPGVDLDDYTRWKANFGQVAGSGAGSLAPSHSAAPEPATPLLALCGSAILLNLRATRRRNTPLVGV